MSAKVATTPDVNSAIQKTISSGQIVTCAEILEKRDTETTPDFLQLKQKPYHFLFVYGTLKQGEPRQDILKDALYAGRGQTQSNAYKMWDFKTGGFPVGVQARATEGNNGHLTGEIYIVDALTFLRLDAIEDNGQMFNRVERYVRFEDQGYPLIGGASGRPFQKCWVYLGDRDFWEGRLTHGCPMTKEGEVWCYKWKTFRPFDPTKKTNPMAF